MEAQAAEARGGPAAGMDLNGGWIHPWGPAESVSAGGPDFWIL